MPIEASIVPIALADSDTVVGAGRSLEELPGTVRRRGDVPEPAGYAVFDCETTGTDPRVDEIVSFAVVLLDADGAETARLARLVRPSVPIPTAATAVHGIGDEDVVDAPRFHEIAEELRGFLRGAVFVAHNVEFDLMILQRAFAGAGVNYWPAGVACTLDAFRLLEPGAANHRLESICERHGIPLDAHVALSDVLATVALLRVLLDEGLAPETVTLDHVAYMRLRSRGDTRPASEPQLRRVFGMARSAGLLCPDGGVDRDQVVALVERVTGIAGVDALTREQVQDVYDTFDRLIEQQPPPVRAANA